MSRQRAKSTGLTLKRRPSVTFQRAIWLEPWETSSLLKDAIRTPFTLELLYLQTLSSKTNMISKNKLQLNYRRITLWLSIGFVLSLGLVWSELLNSSATQFKNINRKENGTIREDTTILREFTDIASLPLCTHNLLDRRNYNFTQWVKEPSDILTSDSLAPCRLLEYTRKRAVSCFDVLSREYYRNNSKPKVLRIVFIGDSRVRQQFYNMVKLIPNYDRTWKPFPFFYHGEIDVENKMLNLQISFKWYPLIKEKVLKMLHQWTNQDEAPYLLFLSMGVHHMLHQHGHDFELYKKKLKELGPVLNKLGEFTEIIWLNHYPTVDSYVADVNRIVDVYEEIIQRYNEAVMRIFKDYDRIRIWDSSNLLAEEYVRGCNLFQRNTAGDYTASYTSCKDYIHTGNVVLLRATQLFLNDMCNSRIS